MEKVQRFKNPEGAPVMILTAGWANPHKCRCLSNSCCSNTNGKCTNIPEYVWVDSNPDHQIGDNYYVTNYFCAKCNNSRTGMYSTSLRFSLEEFEVFKILEE